MAAPRRCVWICAASLIAVSAAAGARPVGPTNGHIIVSTRGDTNIVLLDPTTFEESGRLQAPVGLHEIAASADGRRAVGAAYGSGPRHQTPDQRLLVLHLPDLNPATDDALTLGPVIDLGSSNVRPNDLAFFPDQRHILVTSEIAQKVLKVDLDAPALTGDGGGSHAEAIVREYPFSARAGHMLAVPADVSFCYVPSVADKTVSVIDLDTGQVVAAPEAGAGAEGIAAAPDGSSVWVACLRDNTIAVLDPASNTIAHSISAPGAPFRVRFTPDSARVAVSFPAADEVRIFDAATREVIHAVHLGDGAAPTSIAMSPDGQRLAVVCAATETVAVIDLATGEVLASVALGPVPDGLAWAPAP